VTEESNQLMKFHGVYSQTTATCATSAEEKAKKSVHLHGPRPRPGRSLHDQQWLTLDALADSHGNGTLKITNRQAFQLHGILKGKLRPAVKEINRALLDTIAAAATSTGT